MLQARAALARVASRSGGPAAVQRRALLFASQNNVAVAGGLKVQTAVVRAAAHPMHWSAMCATYAQLNGQLLASPTPGDVRGTVDGVASVLLRHFSSQSGKGDSSVKGGVDEIEASDSDPPKREIPTHGHVYFVVDPLMGHGDGELDVGSTLLRCLTKLTAAQLRRMARLTTGASKHHPSEEAYCFMVWTLLSAASRIVPGFQVAHDVDAGGQRVDMVLDTRDQRHLVEFVAHEPPDGFTDGAVRAGSMAERYERVRSSYAVKLGVPLERCWLVCFDAWDKRSSCREAMWETLDELPAADRGTIDAPAINVMWVFHSYDFEQATYRIDLAGGHDTTRAVIGEWTPLVVT